MSKCHLNSQTSSTFNNQKEQLVNLKSQILLGLRSCCSLWARPPSKCARPRPRPGSRPRGSCPPSLCAHYCLFLWQTNISLYHVTMLPTNALYISWTQPTVKPPTWDSTRLRLGSMLYVIWLPIFTPTNPPLPPRFSTRKHLNRIQKWSCGLP